MAIGLQRYYYEKKENWHHQYLLNPKNYIFTQAY